MANELKTKFTFDADAGIKRIEDTRANMVKLNNEFANFGKNVTFPDFKTPTDNLLKQQATAAKEFQKITSDIQKKLASDFTLSEKHRLATMTAVNADIARMRAQNLAGEKQVSNALAADAKHLADLKIREYKRALSAEASSLNRPGSGGAVTGGGGFGDAFSNRALGGFGSSTAAGFAGGLAGGAVVSAISGVTDALKTGAGAWLDYASNLEQARIGFKTMTGSLALADAHLKELQKFAAATPFEFGQLVDASRKLQGVGFTAKQVVPILKDVGNSLAAAGRIGELPFAIKALGDIQSKGKLAGQEIIQLANAGIPIRDVLAKSLGITHAQVIELSEQGKISAEIVFAALHKMSEEKFGNAMLEQSKTFAGAMSNIKDSLLQIAETAFAPLFKEISSVSSRFADSLINQEPATRSVAFALGQSIGKSIRDGIASPDVGAQLKGAQTGGIGKFAFDFYRGASTLVGAASGDAGALGAGGLDLSETGVKLKADAARKLGQEMIDINKRVAISNLEANLAVQKALPDSGISGIKRNAQLEIDLINEQIKIQDKAADAKIAALSLEELATNKAYQIRADRIEAINKLEASAAVVRINATKAIADEIEKGKKKVEDMGKSMTVTFDNLFVRASKDNVFALVFSEAQKSLDKLREEIRLMPDDLKATALAMEKAFQSNKLFETRLDNSLSAFDLRDSAAKFRSPFEDDLKKFNKDPAKSLEEFTDFYFKKLENATTDKFQKFAQDTTFGGSVRVDSRPFTGYAQVANGPVTQFDLRNALTTVYDRIGGSATDPYAGGGTGVFGGTFSRQRSFQDLGEFEKQKYLSDLNQTDTGALGLQSRLNKQLAIIDQLGAGATGDQLAIANRKIISLTQGIDPRQMTGAQREGSALAREREAVRLEQSESKAFAQREQYIAIMGKMAENQKRMLDIAEKQGIAGIQSMEMTIKDETSGGVQVKTQEPSNADTANYYGNSGLNFMPGGGGRQP